MTLMVPSGAADVFSTQFRFISLCIQLNNVESIQEEELKAHQAIRRTRRSGARWIKWHLSDIPPVMPDL